MKKAWPFLVIASSYLVTAVCWASEGLDVPEPLDKKIALEKLSGLNLIVARLYNDNLILYALACTVLMAVVGVVIAFGTDLLLKAIGMDVSKIEHKE